MATKNIFLYVPNIIGYGRLVLLVISMWYLETSPLLFLSFYCSSIILDGFDGYAARQLNQVTAFGAWLDVAIDNLSRGMLWSHVCRFGWLISSIEWMVFVCTHTLGKSWKSTASSPPLWVQAVMANGFKTPIGAFAILGLHFLPIWFYIEKSKLVERKLSPCVQAYFTLVLAAGRLLCFAVEFWFIQTHIQNMAAFDVEEIQDLNTEEKQPIQPERIIKREVVTKARVRPTPRRSPIRHEGSTMIDMAYTSQGQERDLRKAPRRDNSPSPVRKRRVRESPTRNRRGKEASPSRQRMSQRGRRRSPEGRGSSRQSSQSVLQNESEMEQGGEKNARQEIKRDITSITEVPSIDGDMEQKMITQKDSSSSDDK